MIFTEPEARAAFWSRVNNGRAIPPSLNKCWLWTGSKIGQGGYGEFRFKGKKILAHRLAFLWFVGPIKNGNDICHHCDIPPCIRPSHLFCGTRSDNMRDCAKKGRLYYQQNPEAAPAGIDHPRHGAKITPDDIPKIMRLHESGYLHREIAAQFGVHRVTIGRLLLGRTWGPYTSEQRS